MSSSRHINLHTIANKAMASYGFLSQFPPPVIREVNKLSGRSRLRKHRDQAEDLRSLLWSSIDNFDSLDLDQIEYCNLLPRGEIMVKVAIADVDAFVPKNAHTDKYAENNGTSVYTGVQVFPMLPERLSTDLSSLRVGENRLAIIMEYVVRKGGDTHREKVYRAVVCNKAKLIYEEVGDWLEGKGPLPKRISGVEGLEEQVRLQDEAAQRLQKFRAEQGALEFETIEAKPVVQNMRVKDLVIQSKNRARYLIENFMVAANGAMVRFLERHRRPMIQRVVRIPKDWFRIMDVASLYGDALPPEPNPRALSEFLERRKKSDPDHFPDLSLTIIKLLGAGEYVMVEPGKTKYGHFGLAVHDYTHSTAPNRRYVDVIIQRLLKAVLAGEHSPYTKRELIEHAAWCTDRDKASKKVERFMRKVAAAVLLRDKVGKVFNAIVTGASDKGTYVRLISPPAEGRVLRGEEGMSIGQKVRVRLIGMDPHRGHIDFEQAVNGSRSRTKPPRKMNLKDKRRRKYQRRQRGRKER